MGLAFTRKPGEAFTIGDNITVKVVSVKGQKVLLKIDAPRIYGIARDDAKKGAKDERP